MSDKIRILYIDDYELDRELVKDSLEKEHGGFELLEASNRKEFETLLRKHEFDLVLSDFNIAGFEGLQVLEVVHAHDPQIPVIIVTGTGSEEIAVKSLKQGAADYVIKRPQHIRKLPQTILTVLEKQALIAKRIQAEKALVLSESHLRILVNTIPDLIWLKDQNGVYLSCNLMFERFFGAKESEIVGKTDYDFVDRDLADFFRAKDRKAMAANKPSKNEEELTFADNGYRRLFETIKMPMRDTAGKLIGVLGIARDISELRNAENEKLRLERQLKQNQKMESIGQLAGGIAHDFNNTLYPIIGFTQMSMEELPKNHPVQENLQDILNGAIRARDLVKKILLYSRQKNQKLESIILQPVIEEAIKLLRSTIPANIDIQTQLYDGEDCILCDETEIHEIVMNLCTNAYHAIEDIGGKIKVSLNKTQTNLDSDLPSGEYVCLSVSDNGVGISKEIIDKIFEPYYTTKGVGKGTGMGLSVVHGIVKNYKGDIRVHSYPEEGTVFDIFLPVTTKTIKIEQEDEKVNSLFGTEKILVVDDEKSIVKLVERVLESHGYSVMGIADSTEALTLFKSSPENFDLVISDMAMPGMEGTQLAQKIYEIRPDIPIIICSGFSEKINHEKANRFNIKAFIDKPILMNDLTTKVREILDQSEGGKDE